MIQNDDGSVICLREELLNGSIRVLTSPYPLSEHQFHVLIENKDTHVDDYASKILFIGIGVGLQLVVILGFVLYYQLAHNKEMVDSILLKIDKYQFGLLVLCIVISIVLKGMGTFVKSEKKELIKMIKAHFRK